MKVSYFIQDEIVNIAYSLRKISKKNIINSSKLLYIFFAPTISK